MAINTEFQFVESTLFVKASGVDESYEEVLNYGMSVLNKAVESSCESVLCDEQDVVYKVSIFDTFKLAETASKVAQNLKKIAIVCKTKYLEEGKFYETVAANRGLRILVTDNETHAKEWLAK